MLVGNVPLSNALFLAAFMCPVGCKALLLAYTARQTVPASRLVMTQRRRYGFMVLGQAIIMFAFAQILAAGSVDEVWPAIQEWFAVPPVGWAVGASVIIGGLSLIVSLTAPFWIYYHPSLAARKRFGKRLYVMTEDVRAGIDDYWHTAESTRTQGGLRRYFKPAFGG